MHNIIEKTTKDLTMGTSSVLFNFTAPSTSIEYPQKTRFSGHLTLLFDINKTLIGFDKAGGKSIEQVILSSLSDKVMGVWDQSKQESMSYYDHCKYTLCGGDLKKFRAAKTSFDEKLFSEMERIGHPEIKEMREIFLKSVQTLKTLEENGHQVFPSFYNLIAYLEEQKIPYTLALRTFGSDTEEVRQEIVQKTGLPIQEPVSITEEGVLIIEGNKISIPDYLKMARDSKSHASIQDHFPRWNNNGQKSEYGKPFPVDPTNEEDLTLFFDDNAMINPKSPEQNIVHPYNVHTGKAISHQELIEGKQLFVVDTLEAIYSGNYYIDLVKEAMNANISRKQAP